MNIKVSINGKIEFISKCENYRYKKHEVTLLNKYITLVISKIESWSLINKV